MPIKNLHERLPLARCFLHLALISFLALTATATHAQQPVPTQVMVRVVAHDAKIIGSAAGGVRVVIRDATTGNVLAEGMQEGSTGDTDRIVVQPHQRGDTVYDTEGAAGFLATVPLSKPTLVDIEVEGPLDPPEATLQATHRTWLLPGEHVLGEGLVIPLHGFIVQITALDQKTTKHLTVRATVKLLCTCPITPGGLWDADRLAVQATLRADGRVVAERPLTYADEASTFEGTIPLPENLNAFTVEVTASDPSRANFGYTAQAFEVH